VKPEQFSQVNRVPTHKKIIEGGEMMKNRFFFIPVCLELLVIWASASFAQGLTPVGSFTYVSRAKEGGNLQYAYHEWMNDESQLILARFDGEVVGEYKVLKKITVQKQDIKGNATTYTTENVPEVTNPSTDPTSQTYRYWWGVIGIVGAGKKNVVFEFHNTIGTKEYLLISYEMNGGQLIEVGRLTFVPVTLGETSTTLKRAVVYKESIYVIINDETVADGSTVSSEITQWDIKLSKMKKRTTSPHGEDLHYRHPDANLPTMLPIGYWYEDYEVVNADETWTRNIYIYKY
jgi:hypothetical protein